MNLFEIEQEFFEIVNELEENGGELTPELEARLTIHSDDVDNLIHKYHSFIQWNKRNVEYLKDRKNQLDNRIKASSNTVNRIEEKALDALLKFGNISKTGTRQLKYADLTVFSRETTSVEIDQDVIQDTVIGLDPSLEGIKSIANQDDPFELDDELNTIAKTVITLTLSPYHAKQLMVYINTGIVDLGLERDFDNPEDTLIETKYDIIWDKSAIKKLNHINTKGINVKNNININFR